MRARVHVSASSVRVVIAITLVVALDVDRASCEKRAPPNSNSNAPIVHERIEIGDLARDPTVPESERIRAADEAPA